MAEEFTVVHVNGYGLHHGGVKGSVKLAEKRVPNFRDWMHVMYGEPRNDSMGRVPKALLCARREEADAIVWSTGSSRSREGTIESEYLFNKAIEWYPRMLSDFPSFRGLWASDKRFDAWMGARSSFDRKSMTTFESIEVLETIVREEMNVLPATSLKVISITSANHAPRVQRDLADRFDVGTGAPRYWSDITLHVVPAETNYGNKWVRDVVVQDLGK